MDQEGRGLGWGQGSRMEPAKSEIKFPEVCAPGGLRLKESGFLFEPQLDWKGVGETLTTGAREGNGVAFYGRTHCWTHC